MKSSVILIPSYEPDELLINTIHELKEAGFPILIVNDGSGPEFDKIFEQVKNDVAYFKYDLNHGKGYAMKYGYKRLLEVYPDAKFVITADGDGQHTTKDIIAVHEEMEKCNELVFGVRYFGPEVPAKSKAGNNFSKATRSWLTKTYIQDDQCGLRGFPIRYIPELLKIKGNRYEYEMNEITVFQLKQYPMVTIPIETVYLDGNSRSHFSPFKDTMRIQGIILSNAIISIICFAINLFLIIFLTKSGIFELNIAENVHTNSTISINLAALGSFVIYYSLMSIFFPTRAPFRRMWKELLFLAIRTYFIVLTISPFVDYLHAPIEVLAPIVVFFVSFMNIFFAWVFRKLFKSF